jgi:hypothetical protein
MVFGVGGLVACTGGSGSPGAGANAPQNKQAAAQQIAEASAVLSEVTSAAQSSQAGGVTKKSAVGLDLQTTFGASTSYTASCAGGGTVDIQASVAVDAGTAAGSSSFQGDVQLVTTFHGCKGASGITVDGGPLTITEHSNVSQTTNSGGTSGGTSVQAVVTYDGGVSFAGSLSGSFNFSNLTISSLVNVTSTQGGGSQADVQVQVNGTGTVDGATYSFSNETYSISESGS